MSRLARLAFADLRRQRGYWRHDEQPDNRRPWWSSGMDWKWYPWIGGDEFCRWTLVLGRLVIPLWACRNPSCDGCVGFCQPVSAERPSASPAQEFDLERDCIEGHRAMRGLDDEQRHDRLRQVSTSRPSAPSAPEAER